MLPNVLPIGLFRLHIEGTPFTSNHFLCIFNAYQSGLTETDINNYWKSEDSGMRKCPPSWAKWLCAIIKTLFRVGVSRTYYHTPDLLLIMSSVLYDTSDVDDVGISLNDFFEKSFQYDLQANNNEDLIPRYIQQLELGNNPHAKCYGYALFFVALARAAGTPARMVLSRGVKRNGGSLSHSWAEIFRHGRWEAWDPTNHTCGAPEQYGNEILRAEMNADHMYWIIDELGVRRESNYGF